MILIWHYAEHDYGRMVDRYWRAHFGASGRATISYEGERFRVTASIATQHGRLVSSRPNMFDSLLEAQEHAGALAQRLIEEHGDR